MFFEEVCTKQKKQLKELKSKLASSISSYKELVGKFKVFADLNGELTSKIIKLETSANTTTKTPKKKTTLFEITKKDASTSCIDLCKQACVENTVVDSCSKEIAIMENEQLKQEYVALLTKDLILVNSKTEQAQHHQDNIVKGVKKLDEGSTMV